MPISIKSGGGGNTIGSMVKRFVRQDQYNSGILNLNNKTYLMSGNILIDEQANYPEAYALMAAGKYGRWNSLDTTTTATVARLGMWTKYFNGAYFQCRYINSNYYVFRSTDLITWTQVFANSAQLSIEYGNNTYLIVPRGSTSVYTSLDGITWTVRALNLAGSLSLNIVAFGAGKFIGFGAGSNGAYSTDGITWALISTSPSPVYYPATIVYDSGKFFVTGGLTGGTNYNTSVDGITWTSYKTIAGSSVSSGGAYAKGVFFSWAGTSLYISSDAVTWNTITLPSTISDMTVDGNEFIMILYNGIIMSSTDGATWVQKSDVTTHNVPMPLNVSIRTFYINKINNVAFLGASSGAGVNSDYVFIAYDSAIEVQTKVPSVDTRVVEYLRIK